MAREFAPSGVPEIDDIELMFALAEVLIDRPDASIVMLDQGPARAGYMARHLDTDRVCIVLSSFQILGTVTL